MEALAGGQCELPRGSCDDVVVEHIAAMWAPWNEAMVLTDASGRILTCSPAFTVLVGRSLDQLQGHKPIDYGVGLIEEALSLKMWDQLKRGQPWRGVLKNQAPDGSTWWGYNEIFPIFHRGTIDRYWARVRPVLAPGGRGPTALQTRWDGLVLHPVFQALVNVSDGVPWAFEALIRPQFFDCAVSPMDFYTMVEALDLVDVADRWVLDAIRDALAPRAWPTAYHLTINVRMATLVHGDWLHRFLQDSGVPRDRLILEISERDDMQAEIGGWSALRERYPGVQFALDDWGSGHNDMARLIELQPEWLKIDRSWLLEAQQDGVAQRLLQNFVSWLHDEMPQTRVIMEGIETADDVRVAQSCGILFGQGYFWGRPQPGYDVFS